MKLHLLLPLPCTPTPAVVRPLMLLWSEADGPARRLAVVTLLLVLGASGLTGLAPVFLKLIVDELERTGTSGTYASLLYLIMAYIFAHWLAKLLGEMRSLFHGRTDERLQRKLSQNLFKHVMSLPLCLHLERETGALCQTLINGLLGYRMVLYHFINSILPIVVQLITVGAVLVFFDHAMFLGIVVVSFLLYSLVFWAGVTRIGVPARAVSNAHINASAILTDSLLNYETIKYFNAEEQMSRRFDANLATLERLWAALFRRKMENGVWVAAIFAISLGVSVHIAAVEVQAGRMSLGQFVLITAYILQISRPLEILGFAFRDIAHGMALIEKMTELLVERKEGNLVGQRTALRGGPPDVVFEHVSCFYRPARYVLKDVSFAIPSGKTVAIVGASGSGKSTLMRLLVRLIEPCEGEIRINGVPLRHTSISALRSAIAVVPQDIALINDSIAYNIRLGRPDSTKAEIVEAAKVAYIHDFIISLPDGYETRVGEKGLKLSGGEKQRIAIARAVIKEPVIFVLDETTSSLDVNIERVILNNIIDACSRATALVIAHRLSTVIHADEIVVLEEGHVVECGSHIELLRKNGTYAALWHSQCGQLQSRASSIQL